MYSAPAHVHSALHQDTRGGGKAKQINDVKATSADGVSVATKYVFLSLFYTREGFIHDKTPASYATAHSKMHYRLVK